MYTKLNNSINHYKNILEWYNSLYNFIKIIRSACNTLLKNFGYIQRPIPDITKYNHGYKYPNNFGNLHNFCCYFQKCLEISYKIFGNKDPKNYFLYPKLFGYFQ